MQQYSYISPVHLSGANITLNVSSFSKIYGTGIYMGISRSTQPSTFRGMVKWVSAFGLSNNKMAMVSVVNWQPTGGLIWFKPIGLVQRSAATWRRAALTAWTRVNSRNAATAWWQHHKHWPGIIIIIWRCRCSDDVGWFCRRASVPVHVGRLWVAVRTVRWTETTLSQAHRLQAVRVSHLQSVIFTLRPPHTPSQASPSAPRLDQLDNCRRHRISHTQWRVHDPATVAGKAENERIALKNKQPAKEQLKKKLTWSLKHTWLLTTPAAINRP